MAITSLSQSQAIQVEPRSLRSVSWTTAQLERTCSKILLFLPCLVTTIISSLLIASVVCRWTVPGNMYQLVNHDRASVQIAVQIIAGLLGLAQVSTLRNLINYSARHMFVQRRLTLDELGFYNALTTLQINWALPKLKLFTPVITAAVALGLSAFWAGALTLINVVVVDKEPSSILVSSLDGGPQSFKKGDNTNYTYYGRSYDMDSSVGLVDEGFSKIQQLTSYTYSELGYQSDFTCMRNGSSVSEFVQITGTSTGGIPVIYIFRSSSPISSKVDGGYRVAELNGSNNIRTAKSWIDNTIWMVDYTKPYAYLDIQAMGGYTQLKNIQCMGRFIPTRFSVHVDVVQRLINVTPVTTQDVDNVDSTGVLASQAGDSLAAMSFISTNSYTQILGNMLQNNIFNVKKQGTGEMDEELTLFTASMQALRIGKPIFIYAGAAVNALLVLILLAQAIWTRLWDGLPRFNFSDVKSVIVGTSYSGTQIAEIVRDAHCRTGSVWSGEADDRVAGNIPVNLARGTGGLALIVALTG
ncbi:hypothetical protein BDZ45DRAFT_773305 [Acephala macrosclerotiorum]|nr:hypothetical protein BDZ45DRAFT_773305 [Acephala macrosclerotiorum]